MSNVLSRLPVHQASSLPLPPSARASLASQRSTVRHLADNVANKVGVDGAIALLDEQIRRLRALRRP